MDIVVTYLEEEFIIELKIWHGDQYRKDGIKQLNGYLESREQKKGYLVSFSFLKNKEYTAGYLSDVTTEEVPGIEDKEIYEVIVWKNGDMNRSYKKKDLLEHYFKKNIVFIWATT